MSLKDAFEKAAKAIFDVAEDCLQDVTYRQVGDSLYNADEGIVIDSSTEVSLKGLSESIQFKDRLGDHVDEARQLFYFLADDLGLDPKVGDIVVVDGVEKKVVDCLSDPIKCLWEVGVAW